MIGLFALLEVGTSALLAPAALAVAAAAALGYWMGRRNRAGGDDAAACAGSDSRRGLDDFLAGQMALMDRYETGFAAAMFDVDHLRRVDDEKGRSHADRVLRKIARLIDDSARETDFVACRGGEEFLVVMPRTDLAGGSVFADRLRARVEAELPATISGGLAVALDGDTPESLLARADAALYQAKAAGRNCVWLHDGAGMEAVAGVDAGVAAAEAV